MTSTSSSMNGDEVPSFSWANKIGGAGDDKTTSIDSFEDGSSLVSLAFSGEISIGDLNFTSSGDYDTLIAKVNPDGTYAWASQIIDEEQGYQNYTTHTKKVSTLSDGSSIISAKVHKICAINKASDGIFFKVKAFSQIRVLFLFLVVANK